MFGKKNEIGDVNAAELHRMLKVCPACEGSLSAHQYADFAITVASKEAKPRLLEFFHALTEHRWSEAKRFQDFDPRYNAAVAKVLRCSASSLVILIIRDPEELWESSNIESVEVLSHKLGRNLILKSSRASGARCHSGSRMLDASLTDAHLLLICVDSIGK